MAAPIGQPFMSNSPDSRTDSAFVSKGLLSDAQFAELLIDWEQRVQEAVDSSQPEPWALVGIKRRGAILARRVFNALKKKAGTPILYGELDISLYRDDYHLQAINPRVQGTEIPFAIDGVRVLLVDDVLFTGRTVRAAIDQLLDFGRPRVIQLAVLIDRGHRELPIAGDIVGYSVTTERDDRVKVQLHELDGRDSVQLHSLADG